MKGSQALIKTFLVLGLMALALSAGASSSSYAEVNMPGSNCSPFYNDPSCVDMSPTVVIARWNDWLPHHVVHQDDSYRDVNGGYDHGLDSGRGYGLSNLVGIGNRSGSYSR